MRYDASRAMNRAETGESLFSDRCVLARIVICRIRLQDTTQMGLAKRDDLVGALAANGSDPPFRRRCYQKQSTAPVSLDQAQTFQVTHVFHPPHGRELENAQVR
jgi:hypothetical protein